jgi:hypothetical protein
MNAFAEMLVDGLIRIEEETKATIKFKGETYPATGGAEARGKRIDLGGFQFHSDCPIVVRASVFGEDPLPVQKQTLIYSSGPDIEGLTWRIDEVRTIWGEIIVLECNDPTQ